MDKLLFISPFHHTFPPQNGGQLRAAHLACELSKQVDLHYLSAQTDAREKAALWDARNTSKIQFHHTATSPTRSRTQKIKDALHYRWLMRDAKSPADSTLISLYKAVKSLLQSQSFKTILVAGMPPILLQNLKRQYRFHLIYDAHNIDNLLSKKYSNEKPHDYERQAQYTRDLKKEQTLYKFCDLAFACSSLDKEQLEILNQHKLPVAVIPNGVDCQRNSFQGPITSEPPQLLFCGSLDYHPNQEGLRWFYEKVFPIIKEKRNDIRLCIIGKNASDTSPYQAIKEDPNVSFIGEVEDVRSYYYQSTLAIIPLHTGSGTRLKVLEAMSLGTPIISTTKGAEGIEVFDEVNIQIADQEEDFAHKTLLMINDFQQQKTQSEQALDLVKQSYNWTIIGETAKQTLDTMIK